MSELTARASAVLSEGTTESTGVRKGHTPITNRMRRAMGVGAKFILAGVLASQLAACAGAPGQGGPYGFGNGPGGTGLTLGSTVVGGAVGGIVGNRMSHGPMGTLAGVLLGAAAGNLVGRGLSSFDQQQAHRAEQAAYVAPIGQQVQWQGQNGNSGAFTPVRQGVDQQGNFCREYQTTVNIGGQMQQGYGTACRRPDGSWQIISAADPGPKDQDFAMVTGVAPGYEHLAQGNMTPSARSFG